MGELKTNRLRLVPITMDHVAALHTLSIDPDVRKYLFEDQIIPLARVEEMIVTSQTCFDTHGVGFFALYVHIANDPYDGQFSGFCGLRMFENAKDMELLLGLKPEVWGRGLGGEAARAVLRHGFEDCSLRQVIAAADTPNQRSVRVLQKLGMSFRERRRWHGLDTVFYELSSEEFANS
jgi:[ribosomal protein S5]-alanine N-acetyltransferase